MKVRLKLSALGVAVLLAATGCAPAPAPDPEPLLAVAWSNVDGIPGYDPSGSDVLIAKLVDKNEDGLPSNGDTLTLDKYPLNFEATEFGDFGIEDDLVLWNVIISTSGQVIMSPSPTQSVRLVGDRPGKPDSFLDANTGGQIVDVDDGSRTDLINLPAPTPCDGCLFMPDPPVSAERPSDSDNAFIDVELFY